MTGEITLRGQVMPVGGIKEKMLAAHRAGLKTILLPRRNLQDLEDLPKEVKESIQFIGVDTVGDVIKHAFSSGQPKATGRNKKNPVHKKE
jgi:ATP-dependent Lon protease